MADNLFLLPMSTAASASDTLSLTGAMPALLALALALGLGSLVLHLVVLRMRRTCHSHELLGLERSRASSDAQLQGIQGLLFHLQAVHDLLPRRPVLGAGRSVTTFLRRGAVFPAASCAARSCFFRVLACTTSFLMACTRRLRRAAVTGNSARVCRGIL